MENGSEQNNQTLVLDGHGGTDQALPILLAETISQVGRAKRLSKAANCTSKARCHCSQTGKKKKALGLEEQVISLLEVFSFHKSLCDHIYPNKL